MSEPPQAAAAPSSPTAQNTASTAAENLATTPVAEVNLAISGMTCASCVARVEKKLNKLPGVRATVNLATDEAHLDLSEAGAQLDTTDFLAQVSAAGYEARLISRTELTPRAVRSEDANASARTRDTDPSAAAHPTTAHPNTSAESARAASEVREAAEARTSARIAALRRRFWISLALSIPVVGLSMIPALQFPYWQWVIGALTLPIALWCGWPFHRSAAAALRHGSTTMDTLISLGTLASLGWSTWALLWGGAGGADYRMSMTGIHALATGAAHGSHVYFETAAMIVTFLLLGRWLETRSRRSAGDALRSLLALGADDARRVRTASGADVDEIIPASELAVGDEFLVAPGTKIATDGVVVSGTTAVDASLLTGESTPIDVGPGDEVTGATLTTAGAIRVRATRVGRDTTLAQMGRLLTRAQSGKAPAQALADRVSAVFVPAVILIALVTFGVRLALGNPLDLAIMTAITVLVVACPCALGLATPTALMVGSGRASQRGILIHGPETLESAHSVDTIILDKTGTLTTGTMAVDRVVLPPAGAGGRGAVATRTEALALAASVENYSEHPLARAIVAGARAEGLELRPATDFENLAGQGVRATIGGQRYYAASPRALREAGVDVADWESTLEEAASSGASLVMLARCDAARGSEALALITVRDQLRPTSAAAVAELKNLGLTPILASGDNAATTRAVARAAGIDTVHAEVLPADKVRVVEAARAAGARVAMVGDGVNDAAALAAADLSIAMGSGTDVAKAASDITIVNSDLRNVGAALRISAATLRVIRQNLAWAFGYNLIAIPAAVAGIILPGLAAAAMAASSVIVVLNSLRLRRAE
ncbi:MULTISPECIES: heavy metal translocating P-type ATPase [Actinomycetaceae]|uniref:Heavy metal translocating P-type ATPase n=1 Tax=Schaalia turicensis TaxID=131111 RepID=A0ABZ0RD40_9ACTO|nr:heavy metal translocating P-type ATPase [Actinotignum sanguinis]WPJ88925.1 heavy metal translocating P-type ATPase [Schaalia turicensis]MDK8352760.1 heavy metal translocating P-type ATPase [Actinotignum sanguinis]MDK8512953.1 heavy metal translocating P-type ATPase [Actinotignum sanguinis]MDK8519107.1 heavy metal translocating P-type ATPase [Actinotignum sanguinis]MDK8749398.1 heavy metal translocating P-type ATPase [Actinotignum sanguinis]